LVGVFPSAKPPEKWDLGIQYPLYTKKVPRETFSDTPGEKTACEGGLFGWSFSVSKAAGKMGFGYPIPPIYGKSSKRNFFRYPGKKDRLQGRSFWLEFFRQQSRRKNGIWVSNTPYIRKKFRKKLFSISPEKRPPARAVFLVGVFPSAKPPEKWDLGIPYPLYTKKVPEETFFDTPGKKTACEGGLFGCRNWCVQFLDRKGRSFL